MNVQKIPGVRFCVLFAAGILLQYYFGWKNLPSFIVSVSLVLLLTFLTFVLKNKIFLSVSLTLLIVLLGVYRAQLTNEQVVSKTHITQLGLFDRFVVVKGWINDKTRYSFHNTVLDIQIESIISKGIRYENVTGNIRTIVEDSLHIFGYGDEIIA